MLNYQKQDDKMYIYSHPLFQNVFHCKRIQYLLLKLKTVSPDIWHRSNVAFAMKPEIPDVKNMHLGEELHVPPWNINSLVHLQKENT